MTPEDLTREHLIIALFCKNRVFPALDEFQVAHKLQVSVDGATYCMMAARLMDQGHSKNELITILENLSDARDNNKKPEEIISVPETVVIKEKRTADVIQFTPKKQ